MQLFLIPVLESKVMGVGRSLADFLNSLYVRAPARDLVEFLILLSKSDVLSHISFLRKQKERDSSSALPIIELFRLETTFKIINH